MNPQLFPRRRMLKLALAAAASRFAAPAFAQAPQFQGPFQNYPFSLGVASGDASSDGAVLWTRLAPSPLDPAGGMPAAAAEVSWELAIDENFKQIVRQGKTLARPEAAHSVHVELNGLAPGRPFHYRFHTGAASSPAGRFVTAPAYGATTEHLRIAWASCQHYEQGFFTPYRDMVAQQPDLVIHTGDYIYESSWGPQIRRHTVPEPYSLSDYRLLHALYKLDPDLQAAHAAAPWLFIWDDHEVDNDYAGLVSEEPGVSAEAFLERRMAAYQAYFEHLPLRRRSVLTPGGLMRIWGQLSYGNLADIFLTDGRQFRSPAACPSPTNRGGQIIPQACPDLEDDSREYLGAAQMRWLRSNFGRGPAKWNVLVQPTLLSPFRGAMVDGEPGVWSDGWDGYPAARQRLIDLFAQRQGSNPIVLGGDTHCYWASNVMADYDNESSDTVGTEFVTTSITSLRRGYESISALLPENPHIRHFDNREHGYGLLDLYPDRAEIDLRVVQTPRTREGADAHSQAKFVVEAGNPGVTDA